LRGGACQEKKIIKAMGGQSKEQSGEKKNYYTREREFQKKLSCKTVAAFKGAKNITAEEKKLKSFLEGGLRGKLKLAGYEKKKGRFGYQGRGGRQT